jgi:beta-lactamase class A
VFLQVASTSLLSPGSLEVEFVPHEMSRRAVLGLGTAAGAGIAAGAVFGPGDAGWADAEPVGAAPRDRIRQVYEAQSRNASGVWSAHITAIGGTDPVVLQNAMAVVDAYSVNKIPVAVTVLDKIERGRLNLGDRVELDAGIVVPDDDDGYFYLDSAYPSSLTLGHVMTAMLSQSDNTAVRLCARALAGALEPGEATAAEAVNQLMSRLGLANTQVEQKYGADGQPVVDRFFLGWTTPTEMHDLLVALAAGQLVGTDLTRFLLRILRSPAAMTEGIRRNMSSAERGRIATKGGWFKNEADEGRDGRNEAGIIFDPAGNPALTYALFAHGPFISKDPVRQQADRDNFAATHPALQARAIMGREWLNAVAQMLATETPGIASPAARTPMRRPRSAGNSG